MPSTSSGAMPPGWARRSARCRSGQRPRLRLLRRQCHAPAASTDSSARNGNRVEMFGWSKCEIAGGQLGRDVHAHVPKPTTNTEVTTPAAKIQRRGNASERVPSRSGRVADRAISADVRCRRSDATRPRNASLGPHLDRDTTRVRVSHRAFGDASQRQRLLGVAKHRSRDAISAVRRSHNGPRAGNMCARMKACALALFGVLIGACSSGGPTRNPSVPTSTSATSSTAAVAACDLGVHVVPARDEPHDVVVWASGKIVVGDGALWTVRSALDVPATYQLGRWSLKFPWYTRPFGSRPLLPAAPMVRERSISTQVARRTQWNVGRVEPRVLDIWSWEVIARFETSTLRFRLRVVG